MKFSVSKNKIVQFTNLVKQAISTKTTNPILKTVYLEALEDGWLILRGNSVILDIIAKIKAEVEETGQCCVDNLVLDILPTFEDARYEGDILKNPIKFHLDDGKLVLSQGRKRHRPVYQDAAQYPKPIVVGDYEEIKDRQKLIEVFQKLQISVSTMAGRAILQGFHINPHLKQVVSGDGTRTSLWENIEFPGNIATPPARFVMTILSSISALSERDKLEAKFGVWSGFRSQQLNNDGEIISSWEVVFSQIEGDFPTKPVQLIKDASSAQPKLAVMADKKAVEDVLTVAKIYSDRAYNEGRSAHVVLSKNGEGIIFSMLIPDLVEMEEPLTQCEIEGEDFEYWFHPGMTLEALNVIKSPKVEFRFYGQNKPFLIIDPDNPDYIYLQAPMIKNEKK